MIVQQHWNHWYKYNTWLAGIPMCLLIFFFTIWSNILLINH